MLSRLSFLKHHQWAVQLCTTPVYSISKHLWNFFFLWEIFRVVLVLLQCAPIILLFSSSDEATRKKTYKSENLGTCVSLSSIQISRKKNPFFTLELCVLLWKPFYTLRLYWYHTFIWPLNLTFDSEYLFHLRNQRMLRCLEEHFWRQYYLYLQWEALTWWHQNTLRVYFESKGNFWVQF